MPVNKFPSHCTIFFNKGLAASFCFAKQPQKAPAANYPSLPPLFHPQPESFDLRNDKMIINRLKFSLLHANVSEYIGLFVTSMSI